jgi:hypothetical protein
VLRRLTLRRADGQVYLSRWGLAHDRVGGILLHRMEAPDPGTDLHDHPWWFASLILWGGYDEERADTREAPLLAWIGERAGSPDACRRGVLEERRWGSVKVMRLDHCHRVVRLRRATSWSLVVKGPRRRPWGFYLPGEGGYMSERRYDATVRRDLRSDQPGEERYA